MIIFLSSLLLRAYTRGYVVGILSDRCKSPYRIGTKLFWFNLRGFIAGSNRRAANIKRQKKVRLRRK